jgi:hypothetical protein
MKEIKVPRTEEERLAQIPEYAKMIKEDRARADHQKFVNRMKGDYPRLTKERVEREESQQRGSDS